MRFLPWERAAFRAKSAEKGSFVFQRDVPGGGGYYRGVTSMSVTMTSQEQKKARWDEGPQREDTGPGVRRPLKIGHDTFWACFLISNRRAIAYILSKFFHNSMMPHSRESFPVKFILSVFVE